MKHLFTASSQIKKKKTNKNFQSLAFTLLLLSRAKRQGMTNRLTARPRLTTNYKYHSNVSAGKPEIPALRIIMWYKNAITKTALRREQNYRGVNSKRRRIWDITLKTKSEWAVRECRVSRKIWDASALVTELLQVMLLSAKDVGWAVMVYAIKCWWVNVFCVRKPCWSFWQNYNFSVTVDQTSQSSKNNFWR